MCPCFTTKAFGVGLGLEIARKIIDGHCGRITLDSKLGTGDEVKTEVPYKC